MKLKWKGKKSMKGNLTDLQIFVEVAREKSFTKVAAAQGVTPSTISQTISNLEKRMQVDLLARNTRGVVDLTFLGHKLLKELGHRIDEIQNAVDTITSKSSKVTGKLRLACSEDVLRSTLLPRLTPLLKDNPEIQIEFTASSDSLVFAQERFDAAIRLGSYQDGELSSLPIGDTVRMTVVASPDYLKKHAAPQIPHDLVRHQCINYRATSTSIELWNFFQRDKEVSVRVAGALTFNSVLPLIDAALSGLGIAMVPENMAQQYLNEASLVRVLEDWSTQSKGHYFFYPSNRQLSPALALILDALRA